MCWPPRSGGAGNAASGRRTSSGPNASMRATPPPTAREAAPGHPRVFRALRRHPVRAPRRVVIASITSNAGGYAREVQSALDAAGLRAELDSGNEKIGYQVREHSPAKVPALPAVGRCEAEHHQIATRRPFDRARPKVCVGGRHRRRNLFSPSTHWPLLRSFRTSVRCPASVRLQRPRATAPAQTRRTTTKAGNPHVPSPATFPG